MRDPSPTLDRLGRPGWLLVAGVALGLSFPPYGLYPLAWVAFVPLLARWMRAKTLGQFAVEAYATFLIAAVVVGGWVALHVYPGKALVLALGLLALPLPLVWAFVLAAAVRVRLGMVAGLVALGANVLTVEHLASMGPSALPWLAVGHTQADALPFNGIADVGGVGLLTLWVLAVNIVVFLGACAAVRPGPLPGARTLAALLALAALAAPAAYTDDRATQGTPPVRSVSVGLVQPAAPAELWAAFTDGARVDRLAAQTDSLLRDAPPHDPTRPTPVRTAGARRAPELLVWPEAALPVFGEGAKERRMYARLGVWTARRGTALLAGAITAPRSAPAPSAGSDAGGAGAAYYSSALLFEPGHAPQQYDKMHLAPLLERVPVWGESRIPRESAPPEPGGHYGAGTRRTLLRLDTLGFTATVGFESLLGDHVRRSVGDGASFVVALAQNGWWGPGPSPAQHLRLTRLRAIETRRAVVFATVDGISGLIGPDGAITEATDARTRATARLSVPVHTASTFYVRHGDWAGRGASYVAGVLSLLWLGAVVVRPPQRTVRANAKRRKPKATDRVL